MDPKKAEDVKKFMDLYRTNKGADPTDLIIYGILANQRMGGYDLYKILQAKRYSVGPMIRANKASVYSTLRKMEESGEAEIVEVVKDTNRPQKSIYALTGKGKERLKEMIQQELDRPPVIHANVLGVLGLSQDMKIEELREAVLKKIEELEFIIRVHKSYLEMMPGPIIKVLAKAKLDLHISLLSSMTETLEVIDSEDPGSLFRWPDIKNDRLFNEITKEEGK